MDHVKIFPYFYFRLWLRIYIYISYIYMHILEKHLHTIQVPKDLARVPQFPCSPSYLIGAWAQRDLQFKCISAATRELSGVVLSYMWHIWEKHFCLFHLTKWSIQGCTELTFPIFSALKSPQPQLSSLKNTGRGDIVDIVIHVS